MVGTGKEERDEGIELLHKKVVQFFFLTSSSHFRNSTETTLYLDRDTESSSLSSIRSIFSLHNCLALFASHIVVGVVVPMGLEKFSNLEEIEFSRL